MPYAVAAAVIAGGAAVYSSDQQRKASHTQADAARRASKGQRDQMEQVRADLAPFRDAGASVLPMIMQLTGGDPAAVQAMLEKLPGYQFALRTGLKSTQNAFGSRGLGLSGAAMRGAADYATGLADRTYGDQLNRLLAVAGLGENAGAQVGAYNTQAAQGIGQNIIGGGNALAAGRVGAANALVGGANSAVNAYTMYNMLNQQGYTGLYGSPSGGGGGFDANWAPTTYDGGSMINYGSP